MARQRSDAQKASNVSLTPPQEDVQESKRQYPRGSGLEVRAGSGGLHKKPGYAAPPGRGINREQDPAAPADAEARTTRRGKRRTK